MKKRLLTILLLLPSVIFAQLKGQALIDSLRPALPSMKNDTVKVLALLDIGSSYARLNNMDSLLRYGQLALNLSKQIGWKRGQARGLNSTGAAYLTKEEYDAAINVFSESIPICEAIDDQRLLAQAMCNMALIYDDRGNYTKALDYDFRALKVNEARNDKRGIALVAGNMGAIYNIMHDNDKALEYYTKALKLYEELDMKPNIAAMTGNLGIIYSANRNYEKAIEYGEKQLSINEALNDKRGMANAYVNLAGYYISLRKYNNADECGQKALKLSKEADAKQIAALSLQILGSNYVAQATDSSLQLTEAARLSLIDSAINNYKQASNSYIERSELQPYMDATKKLSDAYKFRGNFSSALDAYMEYDKIKDSIFSIEKSNEITKKELNYAYAKKEDSLKMEGQRKELALQKEMQLNALKYEYEKKQALAKTEKERQQLEFEEQLKRQQIENDFKQHTAELEAEHRQQTERAKAEQDKKNALTAAELKRQKNMVSAAAAVGALLLVVAIMAIRAYRQKRKDNAIIAAEKQRSEELLLNILPAEVADELKEKGGAQARQYEHVSVLFTDFIDFTGFAEHVSPQTLVNELHECFSAFDIIIGRHGMEKIKTIGDAYMAVCGLPHDNSRHAHTAVQAALEIRDFMEKRNKSKRSFKIRIGINSGPVVAGIVGVKKFAYDIWGDTVNTAARMEQHGEAGKVNISQQTYELIANDFKFQHRGKIKAKNKGEIDMYFAEVALTHAPVATA